MDRAVVIGGLVFLCAQFGVGAAAAAQSAPKATQQRRSPEFEKELANLYSRYDRAAWQSPEAVMAGLHSQNDDARLNALHLLGALDEDAYESMHGKNADWEGVADPWQSELRYVALGAGGPQDAIVAVQLRGLVLVAVAVPKDKVWERVAAFKCGSSAFGTKDSYGSANGGDPLGTTVDIGRFYDRGFERHELVLSVVDFPGSGARMYAIDDYVQHEAHFRLYGGELLRTIAFERRSRSCHDDGYSVRKVHDCSIHRRWFYPYGFGYTSSMAGALLVEAEGVAQSPGYDFPFQTDLEERNLKFRSCSTLKFNDETHQFEPFTPPEMPYGAGCAAFVGGEPARPPAVR